jgi:hypothetical protein
MAYLPLYKLEGITGNTTYVIPKGYFIRHMVIYNTTANAITGGLKIGTTNGGSEVLNALAVGASLLSVVADAAVLQKLFSMSSDQTLYIQAVVAWNSANINIYFDLCKLL